MGQVTNFNELYVEQLRDLYSAETQLLDALPKVAEAVSTDKLAKAVRNHHEQTKGHVDRLEKIFNDLGEKPGGHECKAMKGLIKETDEIINEVEKGPVRDAAIIVGAQKVEHYEISGYGSMRTFANLLGNEKHEKLLEETLREEAETDEELTSMAKWVVNEQAVEA